MPSRMWRPRCSRTTGTFSPTRRCTVTFQASCTARCRRPACPIPNGSSRRRVTRAYERRSREATRGRHGGGDEMRRLVTSGACVLAGVAVVLSGVVRAADAPWVPVGPRGGWITALALHHAAPKTIYAASRRSLYKSTDGGATWQLSGKGIGNEWISALGIDPSNPRTVYAGTTSEGVFKSIDAGASWKRMTTNHRLPEVRVIAVDPKSPQTVYVATENGASEDGLAKTTDGGTTWSTITNGLNPYCRAYALAIDPVETATLWLACWGDGVWRSTDGGASWAISGPGPSMARALAVDPES